MDNLIDFDDVGVAQTVVNLDLFGDLTEMALTKAVELDDFDG